jgi:hypothetical protein
MAIEIFPEIDLRQESMQDVVGAFEDVVLLHPTFLSLTACSTGHGFSESANPGALGSPWKRSEAWE